MAFTFRFQINGTGLTYDGRYGVARQSGWCATHRGSYLSPQFVSFWKALRMLSQAHRMAEVEVPIEKPIRLERRRTSWSKWKATKR